MIKRNVPFLEQEENPFLEQELQLVHIILKKLLEQKAIEYLKKAEYIRNHQLKSFV